MDEKWITDWAPSERFPMYTRSNVGEIMPNPCSPLGWDLVWGAGVAFGWMNGHFRWGSSAPDEINHDQPDFIACFGGYVYLNMSLIRLVGERSPGMSAQQMDDILLGSHPDVVPHTPHPDDKRPELEEQIEATMGWIMTITEEPQELMEDRKTILELRENRPDLKTLSNKDLIDRARSVTSYIREFFEPYYVYGTASAVGPGLLSQVCAEIDPSLSGRLISGLDGIDSVPMTVDIWELSRLEKNSSEFANKFESFLKEHGCRGPGEWDAGNPTWEVDPNPVTAAIDAMRNVDNNFSPSSKQAQAAADRLAAEKQAREALAGNDEALELLETGLRVSKIFVPTRERTKLTQMMAIHEVRLPIYELGNRMTNEGHLEEPSDIFLLLNSELDDFIKDPNSFSETISQRRKDFNLLSSLEEPFIVNGQVPPISSWKKKTTSVEPVQVGEIMTGLSGSPGEITGRARVITDPGDPRGLEQGEILVAPITDPAWTPLFIPAAGVVVDVGAPMSHSVIVSREFGIPCVVSVHQAAERIPNGALIQVDGNKGTVTIVELP
ncbi:MAG: PEP-utilizing enzyme [Actinomycetota bacterium]|nr:PEP-utilizing enzyme [Actinomycetota bacterium]|tara:strand:- start:12796 stop:14451 length:1656 start_codon:yes stop_codon:yes gene_type:complete